MIEISVYILVAILLGYFFGWLITKIVLKSRYKKHLDEIEELTLKLRHLEEQQMKINKNHEEEIEAFLFERIDITKKYQELLQKR